MAKQVRSKDGTTIYIEDVPNVTHKICSLFPKEVYLEEGYVVPACDDTTPAAQSGEVGGVKFSFVDVRPKISRRFIGGGKNDTWEARLNITSYDHARDLIGYAFNSEADEPAPTQRTEALEGRGLFVPKGDEPTVAEIKVAQAKQKKFYQAEVQRAQSWWMQHKTMAEVTEVSHIAAKALGDKYEWMAGEQHFGKKSDAELLAEAISKLIPALQQQQAPAAPAAPAKRT